MGDKGKKELHLRIITNLLCTIGIFAILLLVVPRLLMFFMPLLIAWVIAGIANPMVHFLEDKVKIMRKHGSAFVIVFILLLVGGLIYLAIYATVSQISSLMRDLPQLYDSIAGELQHSLAQIHQKIDFIPGNLEDLVGKKN